MLQERAKNEIVKDYMESEMSAFEQDKCELIMEREKYTNLSESER